MHHLTTGRIASAGLIVTLMLALVAEPIAANPFAADGHLPFDMPARSTLASKPKKVFAHYFPPFIQKINNNPPATDYYTVHYLNPYGEGGDHAAYGGLLRQRPLPRAPLHLSEISNMGRSDMRYEVRMARAIGLDGFAVDILDYEGQHWGRVVKLFDAAADEADDFKIMIMPDMNGPIGDSQQDVIDAILELADHPAVFKLSSGEIVVAPYRAENESPAWWTTVKNQLAGNGVNIVLWPVFHGWNKVNPPAVVGNTDLFKNIIRGTSEWGSHSPTGALNLLTNSVANQVHSRKNAAGQNLLWMSPANPHSVRNKHFLYTETRGSETYLNFWKAARGDATNDSADWVQIVTWNDQGEGTVIQPSTRTTHAFYDLTAYYTTWFKMGSQPQITRDTIYAFYRSHSTDATFPIGQPQTQAFTHTGAGSPKNEIELLAFLTDAATLQVVIGGQTHSTNKSAGIQRFRVPLAEGTPIFRIKRNGQLIQEMHGWFEIDNTIQVQNLVYNAMSSRRINPEEDELYLSHWWRRGNYNANIKLTQSYDRSPYDRLTNDLAARYTDTDTNAGNGGGLGYSFLSPGANKTLTVTFDFRIINVADNSLIPTVCLIDGDADPGNFLELFHDTGSGHSLANKLNGGVTPIPGMSVSLGTWYRVQMIVDDIEDGSDTYTVKLTRPNGTTTTVTSLPFRNQLDDVTGVRFFHNGTAGPKGGFLIDNVHVKIE